MKEALAEDASINSICDRLAMTLSWHTMYMTEKDHQKFELKFGGGAHEFMVGLYLDIDETPDADGTHNYYVATIPTKDYRDTYRRFTGADNIDDDRYVSVIVDDVYMADNMTKIKALLDATEEVCPKYEIRQGM